MGIDSRAGHVQNVQLGIPMDAQMTIPRPPKHGNPVNLGVGVGTATISTLRRTMLNDRDKRLTNARRKTGVDRFVDVEAEVDRDDEEVSESEEEEGIFFII